MSKIRSLGASAAGVDAKIAAEQVTERAHQNATYGIRVALLPSITPRLMVAPPTILITNDNAATTVPNPQTKAGSYASIECDDLKAYLPLGVGARALVRGVAGTGWGGAEGATCRWAASSVGSIEDVRLAFLFDGSVFEFMTRQYAGNNVYRLMVDGEYVTRFPQQVGGTSGWPGTVRVTFATRAVREIIIDANGVGNFLYGLSYQNGDTMQPISAPKRRLVVVGDSYAGGAISSCIGSFPGYLARALGFVDYINSGVGSTGWLAAGGYSNLANRLATDVIAHNPTDIIITCGHNDFGFTNAAITAQVQAVLASIRIALPNLRSLVVTGPMFSSGVPGVYTAMNAAIQAGCAASGATFVNTTTIPIFTGSGHIGALTGIGNADLYIGSDGTHPTDTGSEWLGRQLAVRVVNALTGA